MSTLRHQILAVLIVLTATMLGASAALAQTPGATQAWAADLDTAISKRDGAQVPILYYLFNSETGRHETAQAAVFSDPDVSRRMSAIAAAKISIRTTVGADAARQMRFVRVPALAVFSPTGEEVGRLERDEITKERLIALLDKAYPAGATAGGTAAAANTGAGFGGTNSGFGNNNNTGFGGQQNTGERQMIVGWTQLEAMDGPNRGRAVWQNRPIVINQMPQTPPKSWVYFSDVVDNGDHLSARFAPAPQILKQPVDDPATGRSYFEVGQWYECEVIEPARRNPNDGVARIGGKVTFIPNARPGDRVIIEITDVRDTVNLSRLMYTFPR